MKILYLHNALYTSNMAHLLQVKAMCKAMSDIGHDVILSLQSDGKIAIADKDSYPYHIHLRKSLIRNRKIDRYINRTSVIETIKEYQPDIVYLRNPLILKQAIKSKKSVIIELHNYQLHQGYNWLNKYWHRYLKKIAKTRQILKIVCISEALRKYWIKQGLPPEKVITAHDGIDYQEFQKPRTKQQAREQLQFPLDKKIVTYTGRLYKNRKIENIIALAERFKEAIFLVVGGPNNQSNSFKQVALSKNIDNIIFTGQIPHEQVSDYLFASDILLALWSSEVPTINYCSPLKLFEYMAAERIIVAHGFPTIKEVLTHDKNAILVKPDSIDDLIAKTEEALNLTNETSMANHACKLVMEKYTWQKRVVKIFDSLEI